MTKKLQTTTSARIISVGGGKGGVGKSIVAVNLAAAMAQSGRRVVLCDLDLGAANQHLLLGVDRPVAGIAALLNPGITDIREALSGTSITNLRLLAGSGAPVGAANISYGEKMRIIRKLRSLDADVVVVDVGAGVGYNALDFFELGSQRVVVATPQITSIHDAYSFLKGAVLRILRHNAEKSSDLELLEQANASTESEKVTDLLARVGETDPDFSARINLVLSRFGAYLIGNQVMDPKQAGVFQAVSKMMQDYLGITVPILGWLRSSPRVHESVNQRMPLVAGSPCEDGRTLRAIAEALLVDEVALDDDFLMEGDLEGTEDGSQSTLSPELPLTQEMQMRSAEPARPPVTPAVPGVPAAVMPVVYVRPPRKRRPEAKKTITMEGRFRRRITLPGLTPVRGVH